MKRVLSGIRANSDLTLGNYLGALKPWVELQSTTDSAGTEYFFFVPNLHSLLDRPEPAALKAKTLSNVAWFLAAGLDPAKVTMFVQSQVSAHAELAWIFNNFVTMGELSRMTQFKDKSAKQGSEGQLAALFTYPALMAADILLYDADEVPVGDDQRQHVELARDIADRFNNLYGETFRLPQSVSPLSGARVMNLLDPTKKMSKSDEDAGGNIMLNDEPSVIRQKIRRAVTDSGMEVKAAAEKPAISNLLQIYSVVSGRPVGDIEHEYSRHGEGYGRFKRELAEVLVKHLVPIQQRHQELVDDEGTLEKILAAGRAKANTIASQKLADVHLKLGLL